MTTTISEHEKLFDEICNKLNELSGKTVNEDIHEHQSPALEETHMELSMETNMDEGPQRKYEKIQVQMQKFQNELLESHEELREKMKSFESSSHIQSEAHQQMKMLTDQLANERANNTKLSADLAKSLELCLQLQLEIQGLKARAIQIQAEEKKYSQALFEKNKTTQRDLELMTALKEELTLELSKAKSTLAFEQEKWEEQNDAHQKKIQELIESQTELIRAQDELKVDLDLRKKENQELHREIEELSESFTQVEASAQRQNDVMKEVMSVAEGKIVEIKMNLDKKHLESQDYYNHLQQALTQVSVLKQENLALKDYINKLNMYHQQAQHYQAAQLIHPPSPNQ